MKKIIASMLFVLALSLNVSAQTYKWPNGAMTSVASATITSLTTTMTPIAVVNNSTYVQLTVDTSLVLRATVNSNVKAGALLYVKIINNTDAAAHAVTGSTGITMVSYTLTSAKSHVLSFFYDGTNYINTGVIKID